MDLCKLPPYPLTGTTGSKCRIPRRVKVRSMLEKRRGLWISTLLDGCADCKWTKWLTTWWEDYPRVEYLQLWLMTSINWNPWQPNRGWTHWHLALISYTPTKQACKRSSGKEKCYTFHFTNRESLRDTISSYLAAKKRGRGMVFWRDCCLFQEIWMTSRGSLPLWAVCI